MPGDGSTRPGRLTLPVEVRAQEREYVEARRKGAGEPKGGAPVGLALSGGGIRSATFSLGILQALARAGVLRLADYLCTVSGGGYVGSCLSSLLTHTSDEQRPNRCWFDRARFDKDGFDTEGAFPLGHPEQVHHLRSHGDFLIVRRGLFRRETLRAVGTVAVGVTCSVGVYVGLLLAFVAAYLGLAWLLLREDAWTQLAGRSWPGGGAVLAALSPRPWHAVPAAVAGLVFGVVFGLRARRPLDLGGPVHGETREEHAERSRLQRFAALLAAVGAVALAACVVHARATERISSEILLPAVTFAGAWVGCLGAHVRTARRSERDEWTRGFRSVAGAMQGICLALLLGWLLLAGLLVVLWWLRDATVSAGLGALLSLVVARAFARRGTEPPASSRASDRLRAALPRVLLALAVPVFIASSVLLCANIALSARPQSLLIVIALMLGCGIALFCALGLLVDFNRVSPHYFYRDRLIETYLRTEARAPGGPRTVRDDAPMLLSDLGGAAPGEEPAAPYHLLLCSLNLPGSKDLARKDRKSDHFVFARDFCGSTTTGYVPTVEYAGGLVKLCKAMTISGAAASGVMGFHTSSSRAFALTLFNIRLGYWLPSPARYGSAVHPWRLRPRDGAATDAASPRPRWKPQFWPTYLFKELTASTNALSDLVNLSDGGHTGDNVGIYPLLQRRCRLIVACDGERDPEYRFGSLTAAIQQIYTDENVVVEIGLDAIRPGPDGSAPRAHFVVGRIEYPDCGEDDARAKEEGRRRGDPDAAPAIGWLICLKSSFTGADEPATVRSYAAGHADFPHETTADQFFDDAQFEAYRALGQHVGELLVAATGAGTRPSVEDVCGWCERVWSGSGGAEEAPAAGGEAGRVRRALGRHGWNRTRAAEELGVARSTLARLMKRHGIEPPAGR